MRLRIVPAVVAAARVVVPTASAEIIVEPPARKVCIGYDGGGIRLGLSLNHGDRPNRRFWFRVRVVNPAGRLVYSLRNFVYDSDIEAMNFTPFRLGVYRTVFEAYGWRRTAFKTRVLAC